MTPKTILIEQPDLQRLLKAIEDASDVRDDERDTRYCPHCGASVSDWELDEIPIEHEPGCVVLWARELGTKLLGGAK